MMLCTICDSIIHSSLFFRLISISVARIMVICVECARAVNSTFKVFAGGSIRLTRCVRHSFSLLFM